MPIDVSEQIEEAMARKEAALTRFQKACPRL